MMNDILNYILPKNREVLNEHAGKKLLHITVKGGLIPTKPKVLKIIHTVINMLNPFLTNIIFIPKTRP